MCPIPKSRMEFQPGYSWWDFWHYDYPSRWSDLFASFKTGLPHLRRFAIGHNRAWDADPEYEIPFEKELDLVPALMHDRYMAFEGGLVEGHLGPSQFISPGWNEAGDWPQCDDEDREALKTLYGKIKQQVDCGEFTVGDRKVVDLVETRPW